MTNTSEIIVSNNHIDPKRDDGYMIVKLGYIHPPVSGKRQVSLLWGNDKKSDGATSAQVQSDWNQANNTQPDYIKNKPTIPAAQVGDNTYIGLDDTSDTTYTGKDKYIPSVNEATGKLDLTETIAATFLNLDDTPNTYTGQAGKILKVNSGETALEFVSASGNETATSIGALIGGAGDATPNDTDYVATALTSGGILKKITWTNVKAFLKTYFDNEYMTQQKMEGII